MSDCQGNRGGPAEVDDAGGPHLRQPGGHVVGVELVWSRALEAEQDGWQRAVPASGRRERSVQVDTYRGDLAEQALGGEVIGEACRGAHRSHGVRAGRADPHAEQVEHADRHDPSSGIADRDGGGARRTRVHDRPMGTSVQPWEKRAATSRQADDHPPATR